MIELLVPQKILLRRLTDAKFVADVWLESFFRSIFNFVPFSCHPPTIGIPMSFKTNHFDCPLCVWAGHKYDSRYVSYRSLRYYYYARYYTIEALSNNIF